VCNDERTLKIRQRHPTQSSINGIFVYEIHKRPFENAVRRDFFTEWAVNVWNCCVLSRFFKIVFRVWHPACFAGCDFVYGHCKTVCVSNASPVYLLTAFSLCWSTSVLRSVVVLAPLTACRPWTTWRLLNENISVSELVALPLQKHSHLLTYLLTYVVELLALISAT